MRSLSMYGAKDINEIIYLIPKEYRTFGMNYGIIKKYIGLEEFLYNVVELNKKGYVVSGLNPSGPLHVGHFSVFKEVYEWNKLYNLDVLIPLTNDESYVVGKVNSIKESLSIAKEKVASLLEKIGFDKSSFFVDTDNLRLYQTAIYLSKYIPLKEGRRIFGYSFEDNVGKIFYVSAIQIAEILLPQIIDPITGIHEPRPTLLVVGLDQHPYVMLARDVANKLGLIPPAAVYLDFMPSLLDPNKKMSASIKESAIFLDDDEKTIYNKILNGFSGGKSKKEQLETGGDINRCSVFKLLLYLGIDKEHIDEIKYNCIHGKTLCYPCKKKIAELVVNELRKYGFVEN